MIVKWLSGKKKKVEETIWSPLSGKAVQLREVPDPIFSGNPSALGIAIEPADGLVCSPVNGEIIWLFETKHAVCIRGQSGVEIVIHIGLDTVSMRGDGFHARIKNGDRVKAGEPLIEFSLDLIGRKATSTITPILIINPGQVEHLEMYPLLYTQAGRTPLMKIIMKP